MGLRFWEQLRSIWYALKLATFIVGSVVPLLAVSTRLRLAFAICGFCGAAIGSRWGKAEAKDDDVGTRAKRMLYWALGFLATYLILEIGLPYLGLKWPVVYESAVIFWCLVLARAILWALAVGTLARLFAWLDRPAR